MPSPFTAAATAVSRLIGLPSIVTQREFNSSLKRTADTVRHSVEAGEAFLLAADDAYAAVDAIVYETKNFRGQRIEAVVDEVKN